MKCSYTSKLRLRAALFVALFVAGLSCSCAATAPGEPIDDEEPIDMTRSIGIPPWHLWGGTKTVQAPLSLLTIEYSSLQLAKVSYGRPDTWDFLFGAKIVNLTDPVMPSGQVDVYFDVTVGIGRSHLTMPGFEHFTFYWTVAPPPIGIQKYSAEVYGPLRTDVPAPPTPPTNVISEITAQDIQVQTRVSFTGFAAGEVVSVETTALFAPRAHIRPEWFKGEFRGGEDGGT